MAPIECFSLTLWGHVMGKEQLCDGHWCKREWCRALNAEVLLLLWITVTASKANEKRVFFYELIWYVLHKDCTRSVREFVWHGIRIKSQNSACEKNRSKLWYRSLSVRKGVLSIAFESSLKLLPPSEGISCDSAVDGENFATTVALLFTTGFHFLQSMLASVSCLPQIPLPLRTIKNLEGPEVQHR